MCKQRADCRDRRALRPLAEELIQSAQILFVGENRSLANFVTPKGKLVNSRRQAFLRWVIWAFFVVAWTIALEVPGPALDQLPASQFMPTYRILIAKVIHVAAYALLAVLSGWVPLAARYRIIMMFFLMCHAATTEFFQEMLEPIAHRGGSLRDVALDQCGIALGTMVSWRWWTDQKSQISEHQEPNNLQ